MLLVLLAACVHPAAPSRPDCEAGDLAACRAVAAAAPADDKPAWQLDTWACAQGSAEACAAAGDRFARAGTVCTDAACTSGAAPAYAQACARGLATACDAVFALPEEPAARSWVAASAVRACSPKVTAPCARATALGWSGKELAAVVPVTLGVTPLAVLPGGTVLGLDGTELVAEGPAGPFRAPLKAHPSALRATADGRVLAAMPGWTWSIVDGHAYPMHSWPPVAHVEWSSDGAQAVATLGTGSLVGFWDLAAGRPGDVFDVGVRPDGLALSADGRTVAIGGPEAVLLDRVSGSLRPIGACARPAFSPDGAHLACGRGLLQVLDHTGKPEVRVNVPAEAFAWSPDGSRLAAATRDSVAFYAVEGDTLGQERGVVELPPGDVTTLQWSPSGAELLVAHGATAWRLQRAGYASNAAMDRQILDGMRSLPKEPTGPVAAREDLHIHGVVRFGDTHPELGAAHVVAAPDTPGPAPVSARVNLDGSFALGPLARGAWRVTATVGSAETSVRVEPTGRDKTGVTATAELTVPAPVTWEGTVRDAKGKGVAATVGAWAGDRLLASTTTDPRGRYTLSAAGADHVEAWTETASGRGPGDVTLDGPNAPVRFTGPDVVASAGRAWPQADGSTVLVGLAPGAAVTLQAHRAIGARDVAGPPVAATAPSSGTVVPAVATSLLFVRLEHPQTGDAITVDGTPCPLVDDGCRVGLPAGKVRVRAEARNGRSFGHVDVDVRSGDETVIAAPLDGVPVVVTGRVVDRASGTPLAGVTVHFDAASPSGPKTTGPDGRFRLTLREAGAVHLTTSAAVYGTATRDVTVPEAGADLGDVGF